MQFSSTPILVTIELGFILVLALRYGYLERKRSETLASVVLIAWIAAYAVVASALGA